MLVDLNDLYPENVDSNQLFEAGANEMLWTLVAYTHFENST